MAEKKSAKLVERDYTMSQDQYNILEIVDINNKSAYSDSEKYYVYVAVGIATAEVIYKNVKSKEVLYVVPDQFPPLLGRPWIRHLKIQLQEIDIEKNQTDSIFSSKHTRIITLKEKKQVGAVTSAESGALVVVTVVICMDAADGFVPPMYDFAVHYRAEISEMPPHPHDVKHLRHATPPRDLNTASFTKGPSCSEMYNPKNPRVKSQEISFLP
ncbi:hypothetical protein ILUMI_03872 [Ignelater luminosus]|uniref:Uncharacterized protein n=1 Tax=Ignelater luminosus TaxID=2038154 RepID=A0A8K0DA67_IGNLU|nr:hypothetical protein ILUMI_03872 [Ignelater luminosus]